MEQRHERLTRFAALNSAAVLSLPARTRCAFVVKEGADGQIPLRPTFHMLQEEDVATFDLDATSTRWLMQQIKTYDVDNEIVLGILTYDKQVSVSTVVERKRRQREE